MSVSAFRPGRATADPALMEHTALPHHRPYPSLTTTVPKEFVHRTAVAEVLLTDWRRIDDTRFALRAQWPRGHSFFTPVLDRRHDPLIAVETVRQVSTLLCHTEFGVPLDHRFVMWDIGLTVVPEHLEVGGAPAAIDVEVECSDIKRRGNTLVAMRTTMAMHRDGRAVAHGSTSFSSLSPAVYRRLRGDRTSFGVLPPAAPAAPQSVGRALPSDVVLSPTGRRDRWNLRVDTHHPVLFDHPVDHIPGMLLMEAARQAAVAALGPRAVLPGAISAAYHCFAELDIPVLIRTERLDPDHDGSESVTVTGHQDDRLVFTATVATPPRGH